MDPSDEMDGWRLVPDGVPPLGPTLTRTEVPRARSKRKTSANWLPSLLTSLPYSDVYAMYRPSFETDGSRLWPAVTLPFRETISVLPVSRSQASTTVVADRQRRRREVGEGHHLAVPGDGGLRGLSARRHLRPAGERQPDRRALGPVADEDVHRPVGVTGDEVRGARHERHVPPVAADGRRDRAAARKPATELLRDQGGLARRLGQGGRDGSLARHHRAGHAGHGSRCGSRGQERQDQAGRPDPGACAPQGRRYPE